mmetsp:Transcript_6956/g.14984  ORF Transcript_6956/g.14984 Transcript_6956/m.14984 type:complete len:299 (-) Transcript_6956:143-1039(-)
MVEFVRSQFFPRRHGDELRFGGLDAVLLSEVVGRPDLVTGRIAGVEGEPLVAGEFLVLVHELQVVEVFAVHFQIASRELGNVAFLVGVGAGQFAAAFGVGIAVVDGDVGLDDEFAEGVGRVARLAEEEDVAGESGGAGGGEAVDGAGEVAWSSSSGVPIETQSIRSHIDELARLPIELMTRRRPRSRRLLVKLRHVRRNIRLEIHAGHLPQMRIPRRRDGSSHSVIQGDHGGGHARLLPLGVGARQGFGDASLVTGRDEVGGGGAGVGLGEEEDGEEEVHPRGCRWEGEIFVHCSVED